MKQISASIGVRDLPKGKENQVTYACCVDKAEEIRSRLADCFVHSPQLWLSINHSLQSTTVSSKKFDKTIGQIDYIYFGALLSVEKFLVHSTCFDARQGQWSAKLSNNAFVLECRSSNTTYCLSLPLEEIHKEILVIDGEAYSEIILSFDKITIEVRDDANQKLSKYSIRRLFSLFTLRFI